VTWGTERLGLHNQSGRCEATTASTIEAGLLEFERLNFTWVLGIGIWNFWNDSQINWLKIRLCG